MALAAFENTKGQYEDKSEDARFSVRASGFQLFSSADITQMPGVQIRFLEFEVGGLSHDPQLSAWAIRTNHTWISRHLRPAATGSVLG